MNNIEKYNFKKTILIALGIMAAIIVTGIIMLLIFGGSNNNKIPKPPVSIEQVKTEKDFTPVGELKLDENATEETYVAQEEALEERLIIPGYSDTILTEEKGYLLFANPVINKINLSYTVKENGTAILGPVELAPGDTPVKAQLYELLTEGKHVVEIVVNTISGDTVQSGAVMEIVLTKI